LLLGHYNAEILCMDDEVSDAGDFGGILEKGKIFSSNITS
jgi:hypothetical protein